MLLPDFLPAADAFAISGPVRADVVHVVDGDTLLVHARPWPQQMIEVYVRLRGIDAPEIRSRCRSERDAAIAARDHLAAMIADHATVLLENISADKYFGRVVADVALDDGLNPAHELLAADLATAYGAPDPSRSSCDRTPGRRG
ncbi:thermonuclease family protein [Ensifer soli]|uniref:thermonuclease family protein n=1 Tax=Ciceribacter sp. sgz301302 TaxID=3342379 RepID=UPI0035BABF39